MCKRLSKISLAGSGIVENVESAKSLTTGKYIFMFDNNQKKDYANYILENTIQIPSKKLEMITKGRLARTWRRRR